ncbi:MULTISPECIES: NAD(P)/FAD-dependent oxidoreductase [Cedecea]|jgi:NADH dehydrogenase|uniref:Pyridine nucleotide-disulfide oxidoreductase n=1 Tax=Cedecea neteri TaxID=158822 RepID=A0A089PWB1_9ENTR|nr:MULTISPECIES: NAD(P)/FAD-dependent oxidoreductase [Cedecea]AIR03216.1 pyridine nucleotide-disulfide oxidoreductase [Cedecea neteri]NWC64494.1 NAD(P)/FAD-dependent oxidoreductase [Cedecea sp. P7760]
MQQKILILGAGFAGMWAALSAARLAAMYDREDIEITVLAPQPELRVRPRFYETEVASLVAPLQPLFDVTGVTFVKGEAQRIDSVNQCVWYRDEQGNSTPRQYDRLVLATGSNLKRDLIKGAAEHAFDLDQLESALRLEQHISALAQQAESEARNTVIVCGGGFTGIEMATELPGRLRAVLGADTQTRVIVVERGDKIGGRYSSELRDVIATASEELGVEWRLNADVLEVDAEGIVLADGERIASSTVILTAGVQASPLTEQISAPRDKQGRLHVDAFLRVEGQPAIFATGDVARAETDDLGNLALMTCQHAIMLGRFVGYNVAASLLDVAPLPYRQINYVTCLDLGNWGAVFTEGWEQKVTHVREEAKKIKLSITQELIYPPVADRKIAFETADPLAPFV